MDSPVGISGGKYLAGVKMESKINLLGIIAEIILYSYFFIGAFFHLILDVPVFAAALLATATAFAVISNPSQVFKLPCMLSWLIVASMFLIDFTVHKLDSTTLKYYFFWAVLFTDFIILHKNQNFFNRAKVVLLLFLFCHFFFLCPHPKNPLRLALRYDLQLSMANSNNLAYWCAFGALSTICLFFRVLVLRKKILIGCISFVCILVMLSTGSRGALLAFSAALSCYVILAFRPNLRRLFSMGLLILLFCAGIFIFKGQVLRDINMLENRVEIEKYQGYRMSGRVPALISSIEAIGKHPLLGTGKNAVRVNLKFHEDQRKKTPHNGFVIMMLHYGIIPTASYMILWAMIFFKIINLVRSRGGRMVSSDIISELTAFSVFLFLASNMSNYIGISSLFAILYVTKILSVPVKTEYAYSV